MTQKDWILLLVPTIVSIIGFIFTYFKIKKEYRNSLDEKIYVQKKETYIKLIKFFNKYKNVKDEIFLYDIEKFNNIVSEIILFAPKNIMIKCMIIEANLYESNSCVNNLNNLDHNNNEIFLNKIRKCIHEIDNIFADLVFAIRTDLGVKNKKSYWIKFKFFINEIFKRH